MSAPSTGLRAVFSVAGAGLPVISFLARLPAALCPIGTLMMVTALDGIGRAGLVAGALWTGQAAGGPPIGRLADRRGHRPVILAASLANAASIAALVLAVLAGAPVAAQASLAALVGLTVPQVGPLSRTRWIVLTRSRPAGLTGRALSFDTMVDEVGFMIGPALAGAVVVLVHPVAGMVLAGALIAVFGVLFAVHPTAPPGTGRSTARAGTGLLSAGLWTLFAMAVLQGMVLGAANAGVSALAGRLGDSGAAGFVWGGMAVTSVLAGLFVTARPGPRDLTTRLRLAIAAQAALLLLLPWVDGWTGAVVALAGVGCAVAPHLIAVFGLAERAAPLARMGEAMALLGSGLIAGQGVAALVSGQLAERYGHGASFTFSCAAGAAAVAVALARVRRPAFPGAGAASAPELGSVRPA
ncbi:MFS transporter [Streptomyces sp. NPDC015131]|uniref:MFS transporter n=1 Tax=Streptomyces sp. NPDC015131 TaxID=3364941 RepID=UPI0036FAC363